MEKTYMEDFIVGETLISPARTITESDIHSFAALTGDWHPIHTDVEFAKNTPFGQRIAHGLLTLCIGTALPFRLGQYAALPKTFMAFYGIDKLRFVNPVMIGDTIRNEVEVLELTAKDDARGVVTTKHSIKNQRSEDVCVYTTRMLVGRAPKK
jgi:3-hydroxybutyryl-CoA dehydratase